MGSIRQVKFVKPICGLLWASKIQLEAFCEELIPILGEIDLSSTPFKFSFTEYYTEEMGKNLKKCFFSFTKLINPGMLSTIKIATNQIEAGYSYKKKRQVNIDPGYITGAKLVVASTKDFAHRIYLDHGIYGDVQLRYLGRHFKSSPWTYPDYQTDDVLRFFEKVRSQYLKQEKNLHEKDHSI